MEKMRKENPTECMKSLQKLKKEIMGNPYRPAVPFPSPSQVEEAKSILPADIVEKIFTLPIPKLCMKLYHELPSEYGFALVVMFAVRQQYQRDLTDVEYTQVFSYINDPMEKYVKACNARYLLAHIEELAKRDDNCKKGKAYIDKGKVVLAFYEWTGTKMGESSFVEYYNQSLGNEQFKVAQSTLNTAHNHSKISSQDKKAFLSNLNSLLNQYEKEINLSMEIPTVPMDIRCSNVDATASLHENYDVMVAEH